MENKIPDPTNAYVIEGPINMIPTPFYGFFKQPRTFQTTFNASHVPKDYGILANYLKHLNEFKPFETNSICYLNSEPTEPMEEDETNKKQYFKQNISNNGADNNHHHQQPQKEDNKIEVNSGGGDDEGSSPMDIEEEVFDTVIIENHRTIENHRIGDSDLNQNEKDGVSDITNDLGVLDINESSDNSNSEINNEQILISNTNTKIIKNINEDKQRRQLFNEVDNEIDVRNNYGIILNDLEQLENKIINCGLGAAVDAAAQDQNNGNGDDIDKYNSHIYWSLPIPDITIDSNISSQSSDWLFSNQIRDFFVRNRKYSLFYYLLLNTSNLPNSRETFLRHQDPNATLILQST